jgi:hypothetical protein
VTPMEQPQQPDWMTSQERPWRSWLGLGPTPDRRRLETPGVSVSEMRPRGHTGEEAPSRAFYTLHFPLPASGTLQSEQ